MQKKHRKIKISVLLLASIILMMTICSHSAAVSDNDGSAFITKAEFDSLKNDFQHQLTEYNSNIDGKIDAAISGYLSGLTTKETYNVDSILNQLKSYHFTKDFNYFGKKTNIGDYYRYWAYYYFTYGQNALSTGDSVYYGVGLRGGTNVTEPVEKTSGSTNSNYIICGDSNWNNSYIVPNYGVESYNYYYMLAQSSVQSSAPNTYFSSANSVSYTGVFDGSNFGIRFYNGTIGFGGLTRAVALSYSVSPIDLAWSSYDAYALPGNAINTSDDCYYIKNNELVSLGSTDGTFNGCTSRENLYWVNKSNRQYGDGTVDLILTKYKRKYQTKKYYTFIADTVSQIIDKATYYYSGLPIFKASDDGKVTLKLKPANSAGNQTVVSIKNDQFTNASVGSGGISVPDHGCTFTNWTMNSGTVYTIKFNVKKDTTYWIKACPTAGSTTFETTEIKLDVE